MMKKILFRLENSMDTMEKTLTNLLHVPVREQQLSEDRIPLFLSGIYEIKAFIVENQTIFLIHPREFVSLPDIKKHMARLRTILGKNCILYGEGYTRYGIGRLIEMGVPFIFGDNNIYLPNLGIRIHEKTGASLPSIERFSPFTQKMILTALYRQWSCISGKEISERMDVSRMTVNRALIELDSLNLPLTEICGKSRYFQNSLSGKELLETCKAYFINPVKKTYRMMAIPKSVHVKSGFSAFAAYTMLNDGPIPTYALTQEQYRKLEIQDKDIAHREDTPSCLIQIHRYLILNNDVIDPISAVLSIPDDDRNDVRVEQAIQTIQQEVCNGKWTGKI